MAGQGALAREQLERLKARVRRPALYRIAAPRHARPSAQAEAGLIELAYELDVPLVATNECYFAKPDDYVAHDALICIAEGEVIATEDRRRLTPEHYFKSQAEMAALFADIPEAIENTVEIAQALRLSRQVARAHPAALRRWRRGRGTAAAGA